MGRDVSSGTGDVSPGADGAGRPGSARGVGATPARVRPRDRGRRGGDRTREAFLRATAQLLQRQGYAASGLNEIVAASGAPKGSLYFHFPGGKEELAAVAIARSGAGLAGAIESILSAHEQLGAGIAALIDALAAGLQASGYVEGCPVATVALETAASSEELRGAAQQAFESWIAPLHARLHAEGMAAAVAERRAILVLSAIEGALLLARARRSPEPLLAVREELLELSAMWLARRTR
jgi:TetR/AcrR family transcriptional repressor of lmrAB and yxaGH operons